MSNIIVLREPPLAFIDGKEHICPRCVLEGYATQKELRVVTDADALLADERGYYRCDSCARALHPDERDYDAQAIWVLQ